MTSNADTDGIRHADGEPLMPPKQVALYLGIPEDTLYQWRYLGIGPRSMKVGRHLRYRRQDIDRWLDHQATG